jgi:hypothetical protein
MATQSEFMATNNPYTDLPTRGSTEGLYDYLQRLATARGGMMLGKNSPVVDDVLAEEITTKPLGTLVKNVNQDDGGDGPQNDYDPEKAREQNIERAIGLATGKAVPGAQIGAVLGPVGMLIGAGVDYGANTALDKALGEIGFNPDQIETIRENPNMLENLMAEGDFGFQQRGGYKQGFLDKMPSVTNLFSDIFGGDKDRVDPTTQAGWQYGAAPTITRPSNLIGMPQGMLSSGNGYIDSRGNYRNTSNLSNASIAGLAMLAAQGTPIDYMTEDQGSALPGGNIEYQGPSPIDTSGNSGSVDLGSFGSYTESDSASNDWGGFGSEDGWD